MIKEIQLELCPAQSGDTRTIKLKNGDRVVRRPQTISDTKMFKIYCERMKKEKYIFFPENVIRNIGEMIVKILIRHSVKMAHRHPWLRASHVTLICHTYV